MQAYDGPIYIADAAIYLMAHKPELGIKDPYELNEDQYKAALELLRAQRTLVGRYWHDAMVQVDDFKNEGVVASGSWPFQVNLLAGEKKPIASTIPEEGATGWADTTMMHAEAKHPNCAYMWLEHSLTPKVQGDVAAWFGSVPAVPAACKGNELLTDDGCATNGFDNFDKIKFWKTPAAKCEAGGECVPYSLGVGLYRRHRRVTAIDKSGPDLTSPGRSRDGQAHDASRSVRQRLPPFRRGPRRRRRHSRHRGGRVLRHARAVRLRQDDLPAPDRRLRAADAGHIEIFGETAEGVPPYRRNVNTVFQDYALFPHLNVRDNVAYGLMVKGVAKAEREAKRRPRSPWSSSPAMGRAARRSFPAASASAWRSPARWSTARRCCCSTSRSARSTSSCASRCRRS